jgi:hypothetical protein
MNQKEILKKRSLDPIGSPRRKKLNQDSGVSFPQQQTMRTDTGLSIIEQIEAQETQSRVSTGRPKINIK